MLKEELVKRGLSKREAEVSELVVQGLSNKEVGQKLFIAEKTVKFHLTSIYKTLGVKSRAQLIVWCLSNLRFIESDRGAATTAAAPIVGAPTTTTPPAAEEPEMPIGRTTAGGGDMGSEGGF